MTDEFVPPMRLGNYEQYSKARVVELLVESTTRHAATEALYRELKERHEKTKLLADQRAEAARNFEQSAREARLMVDKWRDDFLTVNAQARHFNSLSRIVRVIWALKRAPLRVY